MNRIRHGFLIPVKLLVVLLVGSSFGQESNSSSMGHRFVSDVGAAYEGSVHVFSRPFSWQGSNWLNFGYVIAGTAALSLIDKDVRNFFQRNQGKTGDALARIGQLYGEPLSVVLITGGIYLFGNITDNNWARQTAVMMTATLLPGGIYQTAAKIGAGRARPYLELGNNHFEPFRREEDYYSFVSGHTLVALGTSLVLAGRIQNIIIQGAFYSLGALGGLSRLYKDDHWLSDVMLGGALAAATAHSAAQWIDNNQKSVAGRMNWLVVPYKNGLGLVVNW